MLGRNRDRASVMWDALVDLLTDARDDAIDRAQSAGKRAGSRVSDIGAQTARRGGRAWDALAGHREAMPWRVVAGAAVCGLVVGWAAAELYRRRAPQIGAAIDAAGERVAEAKASVGERIDKAKSTPGGPVNKAKAALRDNDTPAQEPPADM